MEFIKGVVDPTNWSGEDDLLMPTAEEESGAKKWCLVIVLAFIVFTVAVI